MNAASHIAKKLASGGRLAFAFGGSVGDEAYGLIQSTVPGRTDRHNADLPSGSYVIPADVVAGVGEGNSLAGAAIIDQRLNSQPYGIKPASFSRGKSLPSAPSGYQDANGSYQLHNMASQADAGYAHGGAPKDRVPCVLAGGEFVVNPDRIAYHPDLGGGDPNNKDPEHYAKSLKHGHAVLDKWVKLAREKQVKEISKLPGPKK